MISSRVSDVSDVRYVRYLFLEIIELHIEASHLICIANKMTGFYMKRTKYLKTTRFCKD